MGFLIGSRGLEETRKADVKVGYVYGFGASDAPGRIVVTQVTSDRIRYRALGAGGKPGEEKVIERWIGEDLISRGTAAIKRRYGANAKVGVPA